MQIGIDLGATKIEYVLLDNQNKELTRSRIPTPKNYNETIISIIAIIKDIENKNKENLNIGICHPGATDKTTGLIKNAHNSQWLNDKNLIKDLKKNINNNIYLENDANCFCLSEAYDGSASHYETVFGIILGSGCGGGLVINKKIISGSNGLGFGNIQFNQYYANGGRTDGIVSSAGGGLTIAFQTTDGTDITADPNQMNFSRIDVNRTASADPSYGTYGPAASYYLSSASITQYGFTKTIVLISWSSPQAMGKTGGGFYGNASASPNHTFVFV